MGLVDINWPGTGAESGIGRAYFGVALALGRRHGKRAWLAWPFLGACPYLIHLIAIANSYKQPYVESTAAEAIGCFGVLVPSAMGVGIGTILRWGVQSYGGKRKVG